jgi:hypothetical protein
MTRKMKVDFNLYFKEHASSSSFVITPPTPIRKRRSIYFEGSVMVRGRTPAPAATRTAEYSPRKRRRDRRDTDEFEMPPACRVVGAKLKFPLNHEVGDDVVMREPKKIIKWRVNRGKRRRIAASRNRFKGGLLRDRSRVSK